MCQECDEISKMVNLVSTSYSSMTYLMVSNSSLASLRYLNEALLNMESVIGNLQAAVRNYHVSGPQPYDT
jgi:hypothetical protein